MSGTGAAVCSTDLTKILACENGRTVVLRDCGGLKCAAVTTTGTQSALDCR